MNGRSGWTSLSILMCPIASLAIVVMRFQPGASQKRAGYRCRVAEEVVRLPLVSVVADETVIVIKTFYRSGRPVMERASLATFPLWHVVVFAVPRRGIATLP